MSHQGHLGSWAKVAVLGLAVKADDNSKKSKPKDIFPPFSTNFPPSSPAFPCPQFPPHFHPFFLSEWEVERVTEVPP